MKLKEFIEGAIKESPIKILQTGILGKLIELESIENYLNAMYGIELDIEVKPVAQREGRFYGKGVLDSIK